MRKASFWHNYLSNVDGAPNLEERLFLCEEAFADHKESISHMVNDLAPTSVAILGAGYLNDIPFKDLIENKRRILLVDWIDDVTKVGVSRSIITRSASDSPRCLFCTKGGGEDFCVNFSGELLAEGICTNYEVIQEPFDTCKNYEPAKEPRFIKADITGGVGRSFAEKIEVALPSCKTAKAGFAKAISVVGKTKYQPMSIESDSMDLVTSSMVISQFDAEPYTYFSMLLEKQFGRDELIKHEEKLLPLMEDLRTALFTLQVESHIKEIYRLVKKDNKPRVYLSAELFRSFSDNKQFFLVQDMPKALEIIGQYFFFEFGKTVEDKVQRKSKFGNGTSLNQSYRLVPKPQ